MTDSAPNPAGALPARIAPEVRLAIEALVAEHAWLIDHGEAGRIADLFTDDGRLIGLGPDMVGREAIKAWGLARAAMTERTSRHVCTNLRLVDRGDGTVEGHAILTVYRHDGTQPGHPLPFAVADYADVYRLGDDGHWRFGERKLATVFVAR
ncbi:MAG: nuclear transport factor 2 family protein [Pseudorhodoplanes sp.]|nr:nuclear transport factor 2 family protein [Pseudorhodoplanes sp.]